MHAILADFCANVAVPEASAEAMRYYKSGNILWIVQWVWMLVIPLLFLFTGFSARLAGFSKKLGKNWFLTICIYVVLFIAIYQVLSLPLDFYSDYVRQHEFGLSNQTFGRWAVNEGKSFLVTALFGVAFIWIFYLLLKKSQRRWWFYCSLVGIGITLFTTMIYPVWIDPLFNHFGPLKDQQLEKNILELASRAGIEEKHVYEVDISKDTKATNAYVTGIGKTRRIVIWDTTLNAFNEQELLFVMGHEMGHYVLHHMWWLMVYMSVLFIAIGYLIYRSAGAILHRHRKRFGFQHLYEIASFPLLFFLLNLFTLLTTPLSNAFSRHFEREADRFGLEITQNNEAAGEAFAKLGSQNLVNPRPGPIYTFWQGSHPAIGERIEFTNSYCPWRTGAPLVYGRYFQD